jgi:hypothetical protein
VLSKSHCQVRISTPGGAPANPHHASTNPTVPMLSLMKRELHAVPPWSPILALARAVQLQLALPLAPLPTKVLLPLCAAHPVCYYTCISERSA